MSHRSSMALVALSFFALTALPALAQPSPYPSPTAVPEIGRISTSDRHDEPIERTTRTTYVVDRAHIEAKGDRTVADALADVPGVDIYRYGAFGAQATVYLRGASSTSVLVLVDGIPVTPGSNQEIDIGSLSTAGVRRIEVVEGSGATLYGSNAVGGIINIITGVPRGVYLAASGGSFSDRDLRVGAGDGRLGVTFERHIATNDFRYPALTIPGFGAVAAGTRENADAQATAVAFAYDAALGANWTARLRLGADEIHLGVPGSLVYGTDDYARQNTARDQGHLDITHSGKQSATTVTFAGLHQALDYVDPSLVTENPTIDGRTQVSLRHVIEGGPSTLTAGLDLARESAELANIAQYDVNGNVSGYATVGQTQSMSALYAQEQYRFVDGLTISGGVRGENDAPLGSAATPSLGLGIPLAPGTRLVLNAGTAFRVPTIIDRYYPGDANPNLKPERAKDADAALQTTRVLGGASLGYFLRDARDLIQLDSNFVPQNVARASVRGVYATVKTLPYHGFVSTLSVTDTYKAENLSPGVPEARLFFAPVFVTKLSLEHPFGPGGIAFGAQANVMGPHAESRGFNPDGMTTVDLYLRGKLARDTVASVRVRNVGDDRSAAVLGFPTPGRSVQFELSTR